MRKYAIPFALVLCLFLFVSSVPAALTGFIKMKDGYFYDSGTGQPWVPHGIAYQTWNRPLGVWQTTNQIDYDLDEMVKMGANSIRVDFVWKHIEEKGDNQWSWANYDYLVKACEKRDLRIFALIGYQWPPDWFQDAWYTMHPPETDSEGIVHTNRWQSDIINYEHPSARAQYAAFFSAVCGRYATNKAIAAWIVGNEYGYLGLWSGLLDGYDPQSEAAFRTWCAGKYTTISNANVAWGTTYTNFNQVGFPEQYRAYGVEGAIWADAVQWREASVASFTAMGAKAARAADTNHLLSYSTVGMQWGEEDWRYHAEDRTKITAACAATNAALGFFSVNNYPWSILGHESQNGQWGISFTKKVAGVPVLYSETGFTSSETMWPGMNETRQGPLIRNALWESLEAGAIGTHIFSWMDRPWITDREKGFGILYADRNIKPAYWTSRDTFNLMEQVKLNNLLAGSQDPKPDVAFLWTDANDSQYNRYECEMQQMAGALERLGYEPGFINLAELGAGSYTNFKVVILPRNMRVEDVVPNSTNKTVLDFLRTMVIPKGVHVLASADLPGVQNFNGKDRSAAYNELYYLFGLMITDRGGFEAPMRRKEYVSWNWQPIQVKFTTNALGSVTGGYTYRPEVWKYSDEVMVTNGGVIWAQMDSLRNKGFEESASTVTKWDGTWGNVYVRSGWGWAQDGTNMVQMWGDSGMWEDFPVVPYGRYAHSAWLRSNSDDPLRNGAWARVQIEWRDEKGTLLGTSSSYLRLTNATPGNTWVKYIVDAQAPSNAYTGRRITRCGITSTNSAGSVYVDAPQWAPALVVKNHGAGKSAIFLYSVGDNNPDGNTDGQPDVLPWKYRYDVLGSVMSNYFAIQPAIKATGTNAYMCLPEYRTATNGAIIIQVKNYAYNTNLANGGAAQTFTIQSSLLSGKTIRAFEQGKILATNSSGTVQVSLAPDGQEILYAYAPGTNRTELVQIADAPSAVHPFGDKTYQVTVKYDCRATTGLKLKCAFMENGNNGDTVTNEIYSVLTNSVTGSGTATFWMWIPDYSTTDADYKSTPDGGKYQFSAWLENASSVHIADAVPQATILQWGVRPTNSISTSLTKGQSVAVGLEWEDLNEQLYWQNTPLARNSAFPSRVAVFRSLKTESQFSGHLTKVNQVANWLESMGYTNGNLLSVLFDNVTVGSFIDNFEDGNYTGWTRAAGCANWSVSTSPNGLASGTVGYWRFDETAYSNVANEVRDSSGKACHGRAYNGTKITNDARRTRAAYFDGTNDYIEVTNRAVLQVNANLTLSFWVKGRNLGTRRVNPLDKSYGGEFALTIETNRSLTYYHGTARASGKYMSWAALPAGSLTNNAWEHIVITRDVTSRQLKSYINGVLKNSTTYTYSTNTIPSKSTYAVRMGVGYTGLAMGGVMDEVKICTNVWSLGDVMSEYRVGLGSRNLQAARIGNSDNIMVYSGVYTNFTFSTDIRYAKQDNYFSDAEVYFRYQNRDNFYKVGIKNYYGFWRLKYTVRARTNIVDQGWICDFPKTNRPVEGAWYNLKIVASGKTNLVYFNNELKGSFVATNFASGKIGVGSSATQLGIWEPQKGYFFIDDDEYSFWAPEGSAQASGKPLNLDWGYLDGYYNTLILPSVYVMSDIEASNVWTWVTNGLRSVIATDGSVGMKNETGAYDLGRMEKIFGVNTTVSTISNVTKVTIGSVDHYVTLDYKAGNTITASGTAHPWTTVSKAQALGTFASTSASAPALLAYTITNKPGAPAKAFCFNMAADMNGLMATGTLKTLAQRAFEWSRGQAYKLCLELKYQVNAAWPDGDLVLYTTNVWVLVGSGTTNITVAVPTDGIMTGNKCYWASYVYAWDSTNAWADHAGFYSTANDGAFTTLAGKGLQIAGATETAYAGRAWDVWAAYNTTGQASILTFGIKDVGRLSDEDNFNDGNYTGWNITAHTNISWTVASSALRATVNSTGGYSYIYRNGLGIGVTNITIEYQTRFMNGAKHGGLVYRGRVLYVNPQLCGWADGTPNYFTNGTGVTTGKWLNVVVNIRDGSTYMHSDLFVNGVPVFLDEAIESTSYTTNTIGFLSPYSPSGCYVEWDNVRVSDEQYTLTTQSVTGVYLMTNGATAYAFVPDYDPNWWEHEGTLNGAKYKWYMYFRGDGIHSYQDVNVYFAPRLRVEATNFPVNLTRGQTVQVPVEWENLPSVPMRLRINLQEAWSGKVYTTNIFTVTNLTGSGSYSVVVPTNATSGAGYLWSAFMYATNAADPWTERIGSDDTFRFRPDGVGFEPETTVTVVSVVNNTNTIYADTGIPSGSSIYTWQGGTATFNGDYTGITPPEGTKCFMTTGSYWQGWGVFLAGSNMKTYSNGYLKFWARSSSQVKIDLEGPSGTKRTTYIATTTNTWKEFSIPISTFSGVVLTNMYGLFEATTESAGIFYIDNVRWTK